MSDLLTKQQKFASLLSQMLAQVVTMPAVKISFGDFDRPDGYGHNPKSLHYIRLAADFNLFVDDVYIEGDHPAWQQIGELWKRMDPECRWGGDFKIKDYNHFSLTYGGMQ